MEIQLGNFGVSISLWALLIIIAAITNNWNIVGWLIIGAVLIFTALFTAPYLIKYLI